MVLLVLLSILSCENEFSEKDKQEYTQKGKVIAEATFKTLSSQLMVQMKAGGPAQAIPFCNQQAAPLTSEISNKYKVVIKRTSDQLRSFNNKPTKREIDIIKNYKQLLAESKELKPVVEIDSMNKKHFYAPIIMKANCLACHGKLNETMSFKTDSIVKSLYKLDKAIGYNEGDLRGVWSIAFNN